MLAASAACRNGRVPMIWSIRRVGIVVDWLPHDGTGYPRGDQDERDMVGRISLVGGDNDDQVPAPPVRPGHEHRDRAPQPVICLRQRPVVGIVDEVGRDQADCGQGAARTSETRAPAAVVPAGTSLARHRAASLGMYAHGLWLTSWSRCSPGRTAGAWTLVERAVLRPSSGRRPTVPGRCSRTPESSLADH